MDLIFQQIILKIHRKLFEISFAVKFQKIYRILFLKYITYIKSKRNSLIFLFILLNFIYFKDLKFQILLFLVIQEFRK